MKTTQKSKEEVIKKVLRNHPDWGRIRISEYTGIKPASVQRAMQRLDIFRAPGGEWNKSEKPSDPKDVSELALEMLSHRSLTPKELADAVGLDVTQIPKLVEELQRRHSVEILGSSIGLTKPPFGRLELDILGNDWRRFGLVADTHLCCQEERLEALHLQYDLFKSEGIETVFHAGNIVDGYAERINGASVIHSTVDGQIQYTIDNYPQRKGVRTCFITGDDHDGAWNARGVNFGKYLEYEALAQGREDLQYIGHVEADVELCSSSGIAILKIQHPGGGSSYARSYTGQKTVESFEGGEKPAILVQGHFHVSNYMQDRNIHVVSLPGFQDQTIFARKKRLRMEIGGAIMEFKQSPKDGSVTRFRIEFNRYFDRGYYKAFIRSDARIMKGHLVLKQK